MHTKYFERRFAFSSLTIFSTYIIPFCKYLYIHIKYIIHLIYSTVQSNLDTVTFMKVNVGNVFVSFCVILFSSKIKILNSNKFLQRIIDRI